MQFVKDFANRVIFMENGEIIEEGSPKDIFNNPKSKELKEFLENICI